jgi:hypothetical protein
MLSYNNSNTSSHLTRDAKFNEIAHVEIKGDLKNTNEGLLVEGAKATLAEGKSTCKVMLANPCAIAVISAVQVESLA